MANVTEEEIKQKSEQASEEVKVILDDLEKDYPGLTEGFATIVGAGTGAAVSITALSTMGTVAGLSAPGITSGLAAAGGLIGGGMVAGISVLALPVAGLGIIGFSFAKKRKNARLAAALNESISKLFNIQERLIQNAEYFKQEIAMVQGAIKVLQKKLPK